MEMKGGENWKIIIETNFQDFSAFESFLSLNENTFISSFIIFKIL